MNILVTGAVGCIGFSLCESLIKKKHKVFGIDNFDTYYYKFSGSSWCSLFTY
jgi:UDP-glucuronate 4-epimerase